MSILGGSLSECYLLLPYEIIADTYLNYNPSFFGVKWFLASWILLCIELDKRYAVSALNLLFILEFQAMF